MLLSNDRLSWGFIQNPKCASISVEEALGPHALPMPAVRRHALYDPARGDLRRVVGCIVRDPFERVASGYFYWRKHKWAAKSLTFEDFVMGTSKGAALLCGPQYLDFVRTPQMAWARQATNIIRMDQLQDGWERFCADAGLPKLELPHNNRSGLPKNWHKLYDKRLTALVMDRFAEDFSVLGL